MILKWEDNWSDRVMIFRKSRGKITLDDLIETMQSQDFLRAHEGALFSWSFRPYSERYDDMDFGEPTGDTVALNYMEDEDPCPVCSARRYWQYCPKCGEKLIFEEGKA
jgi:hypothetical protein